MPSVNNLATFNEYGHCKDSIRWLEKRGIRLQRLKIKDRKWDTDRINGSSLLGDEEVFSIAHGCPHLIEICQADCDGCDGVTDASLIVPGRFCRQLNFLILESANL